MQIQLLDIQGRIIKDIKTNLNGTHFKLDVSDVAKGFYNVRLIQNNQSVVKTISIL
jgi:hypothetical protein